MTMMNIVRESKVQRVSETNVWKTLLEHRWEVDVLKTNSCLNEGQVLEVIYKTGQDLNLINGSNIWNWIPEDNLAFGMKLYSALFYCPETLIEAAKLSKLFESLLNNHNLNTVVAATMQNIQPRAGDNIKDFAAINMWYERLDERYNFSLGSNILPLLTTDNLNQLMRLDPPYMKDYNTSGNMSAIFGKTLVKEIPEYILEVKLFRRESIQSDPPTSSNINLELSIHPILRLQDQFGFL